MTERPRSAFILDTVRRPCPPSFPRRLESRGSRASWTLACARAALCLAFLLPLLFPPAALCTELMPPPDSPLLEAVKKGDADGVKSILALPGARTEINLKGSYGYTPLATAARNGNLEIAKLLVENEAAIDGPQGDDGRTPLMEASAYGHSEVAGYLISKGAAVNARRKGLTPLLTACDHFSSQFGPVGDKRKTVLLLLEKGADVNVQDESWLKSGMTPLMFAVARGDAELVQALLARGAKIGLKNSKGETALSMAKKEGLEYITGLLEGKTDGKGAQQQARVPAKTFIEAVKEGNLEKISGLVTMGADVNARTEGGSTPLMYAADANRPAIAGFLLSRGADVNAKNGENNTALIYAAIKGNVDAARVLLQNRADVNVRNVAGGDAIIYAVMGKKKEMAKLLLDNGARANEKYDYGKTALIMAIEAGSFDIADLLLQKNADVNLQDEAQKTALMYACEKGDLETVRTLVAMGANVNASSKYGDRPLDAAIANRHVSVVRHLVEHGADFKTTGALSSAVIAGDEEVVKLLRGKGAEINERDLNGKTPLMYAAPGDPGMVKYLLENGADVNARDNDGRTALMAAVESFGKARLQTIRLLLDQKADCRGANSRGETALILAAKMGDAETVRMLLEKGSAVDAEDRQGKTAWTYAFEGSHGAVLVLLEKKGASPSYSGITWEGHTSDQKEEFIKVVADSAEWDDLWKGAFGKKAPDVDFKRYAVACVFLGHSATWLYGIQFGKPFERGSWLVIPYSLLEIELRLSGSFKAGGQYRMTVYEKPKGLGLTIEDAQDQTKKVK